MTPKRASLLKSPPLDAFAQMSLDEAALEHAGAGESFLRIYDWAGFAPFGASFGYFQGYGEVERAVKTRYGGVSIPLVRRLSGGGLVYHDGDLTFSFVFPWPRSQAPSWIYKSIHLGVHLGLKAAGIPSRLWSPASAGISNSGALECFAGPEPKDLVHEDGSKMLGGALRRRRGVGLYQGSLRMERLGASRSRLGRAVSEGLGLVWSALWRDEAPPPAMAAAAERLRRDRYARDDWNRRI